MTSAPVTPREKLVPKAPSNNSSLQLNLKSQRGRIDPAPLSHRSVASIFSPDNSMLYHNLSASTLQHSSVSYKFPQANRFPPIKNTSGNSLYSPSPTSLSSKGTSLGFGNRIDLSEYGNKDARMNPSPDRYSLKSDFDKGHKKGRSFGIPYSYYQKVYLPGSREIPLQVTKELPGPGSYTIEKPVLEGMNKLTLMPKGKMFNEGKATDSPSINRYTPSTEFVLPARFKNISFGVGDRYDFTKVFNDYPGPGSYTPAPILTERYRKKGPI